MDETRTRELSLEAGPRAGGVDPARLVLARYDRDADRFNGPRLGAFWESVALAHEMGRLGQGRRIAVIDTGFDRSFPVLAAQTHLFDTHPQARTAHGSAVALLIHAVAPAATLLLAPVGTDEGLDEERIVAAIGLAVEAGADVINLSMGRSIPYKEAVDDEVTRAAYRDPGGDPLVNHAEHRRAHPDWRTALRPRPADPLERAVSGAIAAGCTVVAAAGNSLSHVYSPGLVTGVVSVGFVKDVRALAKEGGEISQAGKPTGFSQTVWHDLGLVQPAGTIGTSFAAPLTSGLVATMPDRSIIPRYLRAAALAAEADLLATVPQMTGQRYEIAAQLYEDAVNGDPHRHWASEPSSIGPCPECALLAGPSYINGGRHWLRGGRVDAAEQVLRAAAAFAPLSPHAHANLGVTLALRAESVRVAGDVDAVGRLLAEARDEMRRAVDLRPDHEDYRGRLAEFTHGAADPGNWAFRLSSPDTPEDNNREDPT